MSGRIRSIKPEVLDDEISAQLSDAAWRLWVSTWVLADDHGNCRAGSKYLSSSVWQDTDRDVDTPLGELVEGGFVSLYSNKGQRYLHINGWQKHQRIDNAGKARVPGPAEHDGTCDDQLSRTYEHSRGKIREPVGLPEELAEKSASSGGNPVDSPPRARGAHAYAPAQSGGQTTTTITITDHEGDLARARETSPGGLSPPPHSFELTAERRAYADMIPVRDVDDVFRKFQLIAIEKQWVFDAAGWEARWKRFCHDEAKYQRKQRDREPSRESVPPEAVPAKPEPDAVKDPKVISENLRQIRDALSGACVPPWEAT